MNLEEQLKSLNVRAEQGKKELERIGRQYQELENYLQRELPQLREQAIKAEIGKQSALLEERAQIYLKAKESGCLDRLEQDKQIVVKYEEAQKIIQESGLAEIVEIKEERRKAYEEARARINEGMALGEVLCLELPVKREERTTMVILPISQESYQKMMDEKNEEEQGLVYQLAKWIFEYLTETAKPSRVKENQEEGSLEITLEGNYVFAPTGRPRDYDAANIEIKVIDLDSLKLEEEKVGRDETGMKYTVGELAEKLGYSRSGIRTLIKNRCLEAERVSGKSSTGYIWLIPKSSLEKFLKERSLKEVRKGKRKKGNGGKTKPVSGEEWLGTVEAAKLYAERMGQYGMQFEESSVRGGAVIRNYVRAYLRRREKGRKRLKGEKKGKDLRIRRKDLEDFIEKSIREVVVKELKGGATNKELETRFGLSSRQIGSLRAHLTMGNYDKKKK